MGMLLQIVNYLILLRCERNFVKFYTMKSVCVAFLVICALQVDNMNHFVLRHFTKSSGTRTHEIQVFSYFNLSDLMTYFYKAKSSTAAFD